MSNLEAVVKRLEAVAARLEKVGAGGAGQAAGDDENETSVQFQDYEEFLTNSLKPFVDATNKLGGDFAKMGALAQKGFDNVGQLVLATSDCKKPSQPDMMAFLKPAVDAIMAAGDKDRRSDAFNHQTAFAEIMQGLAWVTIAPPMGLPAGHVKGMLEAGDFYFMKVLKTTKELANAADHKAFVRTVKKMMNDLEAYVKKHYKTGLTWKGKGVELKTWKPKAAGAAPGAPAAASTIPPPPAALPTPDKFVPKAEPKKSSGGGMSAVFGELSKGGAITSGLNKVTSDMKTKNRPASERSGKVNVVAKKAAPKAAAKKTAIVRDPNTQLQRGKWMVEYHQDGLVKLSDNLQVKQNVYIYKCGSATIQVPAKCKSITIDGCKKTRVYVSSVVSTVEIVNCQSVHLHILPEQVVNSIAVDKTAGCHIHLNRETAASPALSIITSNISEMNVSLPAETDDQDPTELPVPEQFETKIQDGKLVTVEVSHG